MSVGALTADPALDVIAGRMEEHLISRRWFGGRGRRINTVAIVDAAPLRAGPEHLLLFTLVEVDYAAGERERYHVPLGVRRIDTEPVRNATAGGNTIAEFPGGDRTFAAYDALTDPEFGFALWEDMVAGRTLTTRRGELRFAAAGVTLEGGGADSIHPLGREQSNDSLLRGQTDLLKVMRRVVDGPSIELEMSRALDAVGFSKMAPVLGTIELAEDGMAAPALLGVLQPYLRNATAGWALALTSLRDLFASAEERVERTGGAAEAVAEQGAAFTPEAARLGRTTAELHLALASPDMPVEMRARPVTRDDLAGWSARMLAELDELTSRDDAELDRVRAGRAALAGRVAALGDLPAEGLAIRTHGDYHLGQVLRTDERWNVLDLEGEPARSVAERRARSSPLKDVAGMLRSFDYAAAAALADREGQPSGGREWLARVGQAWSTASRRAFWNAYVERAGEGALLPTGAALMTTLNAFEVEKAIYEARYELGYRPGWARIPISFLAGEAA